MKLYIKNMACGCCKALVQDELEKLGLHIVKIELGEVEIKEDIHGERLNKLNEALIKAGLEVIENKKGILLEKIKKTILESIHDSKERIPIKFSQYLSKKLHYDYNYLSAFFSAMQATTIEQYIITQKIERVKELTLCHNLTVTEIAYQLHYSSVAHLSTQFKKVTGLTLSHFKKLRRERGISQPQPLKKKPGNLNVPNI